MSDQAIVADPQPDEARIVRRGDRQTRYLAQSVILEEAGSSSLIRIAMITIGIVICAFLAWAAVTHVDEVAATSGEVIPAGKVQTIQHLEGGIIKEILVEDGALVDEGQVLLRMDPAQPLADLDQQRARLVSLQMQAERLRAVGEGREPDFSGFDEEYADMVADQLDIYESTMKAMENRRAVLLDQIEQRKTELSVFREQEDTLLRNLQILEEELAMRESLYKKGLTSKMVFLEVQRDVNDAIGELAKVTSERKKTREALNEARNRLAQLETDEREKALNEMGKVASEMAQLRESIRRTQDRVSRLQVRAPTRGIVKGLQANTVGGVIPPGGVLMEIVPLDKELIVETRITPRDVGHVRIGQPVTVKVTTYDFARYGGITGELRDVSATTFLNEDGEPYYKGIVALDRSYVGADPERNRVMPGMTVQADIHTGDKTVLEYLLKPIYTSVNQGFRER